MQNCIFCKIITKEIDSEIVYEDEEILAFKDIQPIAPVHILIIPKKHIPTIDDLKDGDQHLISRMIFTAKDLARDLRIAESGYKLLFRVKKYGGQEIDHVHLHLIGGARLVEKIYPADIEK